MKPKSGKKSAFSKLGLLTSLSSSGEKCHLPSSLVEIPLPFRSSSSLGPITTQITLSGAAVGLYWSLLAASSLFISEASLLFSVNGSDFPGEQLGTRKSSFSTAADH